MLLRDFIKEKLELEEINNELDFIRLLSTLFLIHKEVAPEAAFELLFALNCKIEVMNNIPSFIGATFKSNVPTLVINPPIFNQFLNKLDIVEFIQIIRHEILHIISLHPIRALDFNEMYKNKFNPETISMISNMFEDSLIHDLINQPKIYVDKNKKEKFGVSPYPEFIKEFADQYEGILKVDKKNFIENLKKKKLIEDIIYYVLDNLNSPEISRHTAQSNKNSNNNSNEKNKRKDNNSSKSENDNMRDVIPAKDSNIEGASEKMKQVLEIVEKGMKSIGSMPSYVKEVLKEWYYVNINIDVEDIDRIFNEVNRTYEKMHVLNINNAIPNNIRVPTYPLDYGKIALFIVDTSGSIGKKEATLFFSIMKSLANKYKVYYNEIDTELKYEEHIPFNKSADELEFLGRGGTDFKDLEKLKDISPKEFSVVIILSDGWVEEFPETPPINSKFLFFSTDKRPENLPDYMQFYKIEKIVHKKDYKNNE